MPTKPSSKNNYFYYILLTILILLTISNIIYLVFPKTEKILGESSINKEGVFWYELLNKHPKYIPGWIEIGRLDKVIEIDPNYLSTN